MKFCPMCAESHDVRTTVCQSCNYEEKPLSLISDEEMNELMAPYEYELIPDGVRINGVKNPRSMRGKVAIPHFVTEIAADALGGCKFLGRLDLPLGLRSIGDAAFAHCGDLYDVFIPESVSYMGKGVFADCYELRVISAAAPTQPSTWDREWLCGCSAGVEWSSTDET